MARGFGSPDDVAVDGGRVLFGDMDRNVLASVQGGKVRVLASGLRGPEGIVVRSGHVVVVAEQVANRITQLSLTTGARKVLLQLRNTTGNEGVDGIGAAPNGGIYVPNSPYGTLLTLDSHLRLHTVARDMGRPVGATRYAGGVAVPDETAHAIWLVRNGAAQRIATLSTPDDVVVFRGALLAVTLGDGGLWEVRPHLHLLRSGFGQPQGLAVLNGDSVVIADSQANTLDRVSGLGTCSL